MCYFPIFTICWIFDSEVDGSVRLLFLSIGKRTIVDAVTLECAGLCILPEIELFLLPVTEDIIFSWFKRHLKPRKANIKASLKAMVSLSVSSKQNPSTCNLLRNNRNVCVLKAPPPVTKTWRLCLCFDAFSKWRTSRACLHASNSLSVVCSAYVLSRSGILCFFDYNKKNISTDMIY